MAYAEHKKGGNCLKSKSSNNQKRKEIKESSSHFLRVNAKKQIKEQLEDV